MRIDSHKEGIRQLLDRVINVQELYLLRPANLSIFLSPGDKNCNSIASTLSSLSWKIKLISSKKYCYKNVWKWRHFFFKICADSNDCLDLEHFFPRLKSAWIWRLKSSLYNDRRKIEVRFFSDIFSRFEWNRATCPCHSNACGSL